MASLLWPRQKNILLIWIIFWNHFGLIGCENDEIDLTVEILGTIEPSSEAEITTISEVTPGATGLDEVACMKKRKECCEDQDVEEDNDVRKCYIQMKDKIPAENEKSPEKILIFLSCFVECVYKRKQFLGKRDSFNMKMVKDYAKRMFPDRPKEIKYFLEKFNYCRKEGLKTYMLVKLNPVGMVLLWRACRPYLMFVFFCELDYHKKFDCPYFRWQARKNTKYVEPCQKAKEECYAIDGITLSKDIK